MFNSILHFNEFGVKKLTEKIEKFTEDGKKDIGDLIMMTGEVLRDLHCQIISETLELMDEVYKESSERKKKWYVEHSEVDNSFMATCGLIKYKRTYYKSKDTGERSYLVDEAVGIEKHMRMSKDVVINVLDQVADSSYRLSGERATYTEDIISKQGVMKQVHELEIPANNYEEPKIKRKCPILYIDADEDHVSLQFQKKKGDLKEVKGRKNNTAMPKLIYVHEGVEEVGKGRRSLKNRHCFGGLYKNNEVLWDEVAYYIDTYYDTEGIEQIYLSGDGASWIKKGVEVLGAKCSFVLDKYHMNKYIVEATSHLGDTAGDARERIKDAISFEDKKEVQKIFEHIVGVTEQETKKNAVKRAERYLMNHWEGIIIREQDEMASIGCSAEGHISHIYADRLSSRPLGWSPVGVDKMARLRVYKANGGKICDLLDYKEGKKEKALDEEMRKAIDKEIKKKQRIYKDAFAAETIVKEKGKATGLYKALKSLCG